MWVWRRLHKIASHLANVKDHVGSRSADVPPEMSDGELSGYDDCASSGMGCWQESKAA